MIQYTKQAQMLDAFEAMDKALKAEIDDMKKSNDKTHASINELHTSNLNTLRYRSMNIQMLYVEHLCVSLNSPYCQWKGFCTTWLARAPSQRVQQFILRPCLQNLFDTIFIQSFTDPHQK